MQGNHTWVPLLTLQEYDLAGLYIGCGLQNLSDTRNADRYSTTVTWTVRHQRFNSSTDDIAIKSDKNDVQKVSVYSELKFPVCGELFVFREDGMLLSAKLHKHFLPSQNVFPRADISCLLKLLASVQKSILLENSHMQKWTCGTWFDKSHQSKGSIKVVQLWRWEPDTIWEVKSQSGKARRGRGKVQLHNHVCGVFWFFGFFLF